jgi:hypothetical protein
MKMDEMNEYLEDRGFIVKRHYDTFRKEYVFDISKDGMARRSYYKYDTPQGQHAFLDRLVREFNAAYVLHNSNERYESRLKNYTSYSNIPTKRCFIPGIEDVIFNGPATIVKWSDGTKTVVKCCEDDLFDPEKGLAMAISKKALGDLKEVKKWTKKHEAEQSSIKQTFERLSAAMRKTGFGL